MHWWMTGPLLGLALAAAFIYYNEKGQWPKWVIRFLNWKPFENRNSKVR